MTLNDLKKSFPDDKCLLCGNGRPSFIGVFVPDKSDQWGGVTDKQRLFRYCLCNKCKDMLDAEERVEKVIRAELAGGCVINE